MPAQIDIILPLHNAEATIGTALASIRCQTMPEWRAIVVDDGSTDEGPSIVRAVAARDARVTLLSQPNGGVASARNAGLDAAEAPFVMFLDADDWLLPRAMQRLVEAARRGGPGAGAFGGFEFHDAAGHWLADERPSFESIGLHELLGLVFLVVHGHLLPRSAVAGQRFDPSLGVVEDTDLWLRLAAEGQRWVNCGAPVGAYRVRPTSRSFDFASMLACSGRVYRGAFDRAGRAGWGGRGLDLSEARLGRIGASTALAYATRLALRGETDGAGVLFGSAPGDKRLTAPQLAVMAWQGVILGLGLAPWDAAHTEDWRAGLGRWWERCRVEGWADDATIERAGALLDERIERSRPPGVAHPSHRAVSVVVPLHQSARTIGRALASVADAGVPGFECVIVNDGSSDDGPAIAQDLCERDRRFGLRHQLNKGLAGARNTGIDHARGRYVHFLDADDWVEAGGLGSLLDAAEGSGAPGACGAFRLCDGAGAEIGVHRHAFGRLDLGALLDGAFVVCNSLLLSRAALGARRFDESLGRVEDYDLWLRLAETGVAWATTGEVVCGYRAVAGSMSKQFDDMFQQARRVFAASLGRLGPSARARAAAIDQRLALIWSTRAAVCQGSPDAAMAILGHIENTPFITPSSAAAAGEAAVTIGLGRRFVVDGQEEKRWAPALLEFWSRCESSGWTVDGFRHTVVQALAMGTITPDEMCRSILARCAEAGELLLIGLGNNGRRLAWHALHAGFMVRARDERFPPGSVVAGLERVRLEAMDAPVSGAARVVVITPTDDAALWSMFAGRAPHARMIRWSAVAMELAGRARGVLAAYAPAPTVAGA